MAKTERLPGGGGPQNRPDFAAGKWGKESKLRDQYQRRPGGMKVSIFQGMGRAWGRMRRQEGLSGKGP